MTNYFTKLNSINVSEHIEKKGQFSYLSWPYAVAQLRQADPAATWHVARFAACPTSRLSVATSLKSRLPSRA
jgi:hypothetical protein